LLRKTKVLWSHTLTPEEVDGFDLTQDVLQTLARVCGRSIPHSHLLAHMQKEGLERPTVHILPEKEEHPEFKARFVEIQ
jgi:hypothetical protein